MRHDTTHFSAALMALALASTVRFSLAAAVFFVAKYSAALAWADSWMFMRTLMNCSHHPTDTAVSYGSAPRYQHARQSSLGSANLGHVIALVDVTVALVTQPQHLHATLLVGTLPPAVSLAPLTLASLDALL